MDDLRLKGLKRWARVEHNHFPPSLDVFLMEKLFSLSVAQTFKTPRKPPNKVVGIIERFKNLLMCFWIGTNNNQPREVFFFIVVNFSFCITHYTNYLVIFLNFFTSTGYVVCVYSLSSFDSHFHFRYSKIEKKKAEQKRFFLDKSKSSSPNKKIF